MVFVPLERLFLAYVVFVTLRVALEGEKPTLSTPSPGMTEERVKQEYLPLTDQKIPK